MLQVASRAGRLRAIDAMARSMSSIGVPRCCSVAFQWPNAKEAGSLQSAQRNAARKRPNSPVRTRWRREPASRRDRPKQISAATGVQRYTVEGSSSRSRRKALGRLCMNSEAALVSRSNIRTGSAPDSCGHLRCRLGRHLHHHGGVASLARSSDHSKTGPQASMSSLPRPVDTTPRSDGSGLFLALLQPGPVRRARIAENTRLCSAR